MARLVTELRVDTTGLQPLYASMRSLCEALQTADFDGEIEVTSDSDGFAFRGQLFAAIKCAGLGGCVARIIATPTFRMPLFATEVCRRVPGVKVVWMGGWPHFSAPDDDPDIEPVPELPAGVTA
jgi:hypothetical protein